MEEGEGGYPSREVRAEWRYCYAKKEKWKYGIH